MTMMTHRHRSSLHPWRLLTVGLLPLALSGCLARVPERATPESSAIATIPARFFTATVAALPPSAPPPGRYTVGPLVVLDPGDPASTYAAALLRSETKGLRLTLRAEGLSTAAPPMVSYELVTTSGVFRPLADGEWDRATVQGGGWTASGTLIFVVPRDLRIGQLEIVDYYYPQARPELQATPGIFVPLVRRNLATFTLDHLP